MWLAHSSVWVRASGFQCIHVEYLSLHCAQFGWANGFSTATNIPKTWLDGQSSLPVSSFVFRVLLPALKISIVYEKGVSGSSSHKTAVCSSQPLVENCHPFARACACVCVRLESVSYYYNCCCYQWQQHASRFRIFIVISVIIHQLHGIEQGTHTHTHTVRRVAIGSIGRLCVIFYVCIKNKILHNDANGPPQYFWCRKPNWPARVQVEKEIN